MSTHQYNWLLALSAIAWQKRDQDDDEDGNSLALTHVYAHAGIFQDASNSAANDQLSAMLILALLQWLNSAKSIANLFVLLAFLREINARQNFGGLPRIPHEMGVPASLALPPASAISITSPQ